MLPTHNVQDDKAAPSQQSRPVTQLRVLLVLEYSGSSHWALWQAVASLGVDLHIVANVDAPIAPALPFIPEPPDFGTFHPLSPRRLRGDRPLWWHYKGLDVVIDKVRPDLLHLKTEPWSLVTGQALRVNISTVVHGAEMLYDQGGTVEREVRRFIAKRNLQRLDGFVGWNTSAVTAARSWGLPLSAPTLVAPAEIPEPDLFSAAALARITTREEHQFGDDFVVGFFGRYVSEKGLAWLIDAFGEISQVGTQLACFGSGPDVSIIHTASARTAGRVRDFGPVPLKDVGRTMAGIDVLVVPSTHGPDWVEQFGKVAVEAMLVRVPVVVSRVGALPEVIGGSGLLVDEFDVKGLTAAIERVKDDRDFRLGLAKAGQMHAIAMFEPRKVAERLVDFWERVIGQGNR